MDSNTQIRVWFSADGYRDPDDNLATLVGGAQIKTIASSNGRVSVGGFVYGDTKDGGQYYMLNPTGTAPGSFGTDSRYSSVSGNKQAAGNYAFYKQYSKEALKDLGSGWKLFDTLASDNGGRRAWNFDSNSKSGISPASAALANDIVSAINKSNAAVVYSAGGGANVPAEAIGYLLNQGYSKSVLIEHFAVVQHGRSNWASNYEPEARELTREFTIAISNQNMAKYANGMKGPGLKNAITNKAAIDGSKYGADFDKALDVAIGTKAFGSLSNATYKSTLDASDAGSHAYAVDLGDLQGAWNDRMRPGDNLPSGDAWAHRIDGSGGARLREIYSEFTAKKIASLFSGSGSAPSAPEDDTPDEDTPDNDTPDNDTPDTPDTPDNGTPDNDTPDEDTPDDDVPDGSSGGGSAPFATGGTPLTQGAAKLYGIGLDNKAASIAKVDGKIGVGATGDANEIDHKGSGSEAIGFDFGGEVDQFSFRLVGLGSKNGALEAAKLTVYDDDGDVLDTYLLKKGGGYTLDLADGAHYARLEAADWIEDAGTAPRNAEPDFSLHSFSLDYV